VFLDRQLSKSEGCTRLYYSRRWMKAEARLILSSSSGRHGLVVDRRLHEYPDFDICKSWIETCTTCHDICQPMEDRFLPTRVIDVGKRILHQSLWRQKERKDAMSL
jgi:hypothetical protein